MMESWTLRASCPRETTALRHHVAQIVRSCFMPGVVKNCFTRSTPSAGPDGVTHRAELSQSYIIKPGPVE